VLITLKQCNQMILLLSTAKPNNSQIKSTAKPNYSL